MYNYNEFTNKAFIIIDDIVYFKRIIYKYDHLQHVNFMSIQIPHNRTFCEKFMLNIHD